MVSRGVRRRSPVRVTCARGSATRPQDEVDHHRQQHDDQQRTQDVEGGPDRIILVIGTTPEP